MIVRILGEGQYEIPDSAVDGLNALDAKVDAALAANDEQAFQSALAPLIGAVKSTGTLVDPTTIVPSDLVLPHEGASLVEVREFLASEDVDS